ncbi:MAG TPA: hypothetical protein VHA52_02400 [Candidatus Babeliaceae bacterium]|nr:hypothetical protein [Candidatus Babeliaceae bacterium]
MHEHIEKIRTSLQALYDQLDRNLSLDYVSFNIEYNNDYYYFYTPTTLQEKREQQQLRKRFIKKILKQALKEELNSLFLTDPLYKEGLRYNIWNAIKSFSEEYLSKFEAVNEINTSEAYEINDVCPEIGKKARPLDLDSHAVFFQQENLSDEQVEQFFKRKYGHLFDSESRDATLTQDSTK